MNGVDLLKCISDKTRFEILELLQKNKELCVNDLVERLEIHQPLVSHHLKTLRQCGIVKSRDIGKKSMYAITSEQLSELISNVTETSKKMPVLCSDDKCC